MTACGFMVMTPSGREYRGAVQSHTGGTRCVRCRNHCSCRNKGLNADPNESARGKKLNFDEEPQMPETLGDPWSKFEGHCSDEVITYGATDPSRHYVHTKTKIEIYTISSSAGGQTHHPGTEREAWSRGLCPATMTGPLDLSLWWSTNDAAFCSYGRLASPPPGVRVYSKNKRLGLWRRGL